MTDNIINVVCDVLKLDIDKIYSKNQERKYCDARHIAIYILRLDENKITYKQLSSLFKFKSHASAIHSEMECKKLLKIDKDFQDKYNKILKKLNL